MEGYKKYFGSFEDKIDNVSFSATMSSFSEVKDNDVESSNTMEQMCTSQGSGEIFNSAQDFQLNLDTTNLQDNDLPPAVEDNSDESEDDLSDEIKEDRTLLQFSNK